MNEATTKVAIVSGGATLIGLACAIGLLTNWLTHVPYTIALTLLAFMAISMAAAGRQV